jgi:hypothetical protein
MADWDPDDVGGEDGEVAEHRIDEPPAVRTTPSRPRGRPAGSTRKRAGRKRGAHSLGTHPNPIPLKQQLEYPYRLAGTFAHSRGLPYTGDTLIRVAPEAAEAWDNFLQRWPDLHDMLERGMIASDVIALVMVHLQIVQAARQELAQRQAQTQDTYNPQEGAGEGAAA